MIKHIVCFKLKDSADAEKAKETLLSMEGKVPQLRSIEVGSMQALEEYQRDEYHCSVVKPFMHAVRQTSVAVDYEI